LSFAINAHLETSLRADALLWLVNWVFRALLILPKLVALTVISRNTRFHEFESANYQIAIPFALIATERIKELIPIAITGFLCDIFLNFQKKKENRQLNIELRI